MEQLNTILEHNFGYLEKAPCVNTTCTQHASNTSLHNVYDMLPKREYGLLLKQLEEWGVAYPKAVCKKHGVLTVKKAVDYVKATPNVRNKGGYFTFMVRQLKMQADNAPKIEEKHQEGINIPKEDLTPVKIDLDQCKIENWKEARQFLCDVYSGKIEQDEKVVELVNQVKRKYNFA